jgi:hypothetical protein
MTERTRNRDRIVEDSWGLRTDRAQRAFGRFCLSWIGASRQFGFGSAHLVLRTAEDLSEGLCPAVQPATEVVEERRSRDNSVSAGQDDDTRATASKTVRRRPRGA